MIGDIRAEITLKWQVPKYELPLWGERRADHALVIPVINEGDRIQALLTRMADIGISRHADIIIVDSGSTDGSLALEFLESKDVRGLLVKTGPGQLSAQLRCAYSFALQQGYPGIVTIDGNNKDDPDPIPAFIQALKSGYDFVQASRFIPGGEAINTPKSRDLAIRLVHAPVLSIFSGFRWTDTTQGFRGYSRKLMMDERVAPFRDIFVAYELLAYLSYRAPKLGFKCVELPTIRRYPSEGAVPTKIGGIRGNLTLLQVLYKTISGKYDPA